MAPSVLIVEDDSLVAFATEMVLADFGFDVVGIAATGESAVELFERHHPDVVLMDVHLKGRMDGCETAAILRSRGDTAIIFVTGQSDLATKERLLRAEPAGYLVKPFTPDRLRQVIDAAKPGPIGTA